MDAESVKAFYDTLDRYAGWLDRAQTSVKVRADIRALGSAIETRSDPLPHLHALDTNLARLPSGDLRKMLRAAAAGIRRAIENAG